MKKDFRLSAQTTVYVTSKAETNNFPYAAICRQKEENGTKRFFYMNLNTLLELLGMILQVYCILKRDCGYEQTLYLCRPSEEKSMCALATQVKSLLG